jgi:hypothetical protein
MLEKKWMGEKWFAVQSTLRRKVDSSLIFISDLKVEISEVGGRYT